MTAGENKTSWRGIVTSVQPRIRLTRSFDERSHTYQGYVLTLQGLIDEDEREFRVAIGEGSHRKHQFQIGDQLSGLGVPVADPRIETAELYKVSKLKFADRSSGEPAKAPPWNGVPPGLTTYRERGHRRLAARTFDDKCSACIWGCRMAVEMIIDHWNPSKRRYRFETFCYGPLSCHFYKSGTARKVPGRKGMTYVEEDWVDEEATSHRDPDE
jgi:hypothetical protein